MYDLPPVVRNGIKLQIFLSFIVSLNVLSDGLSIGWYGVKIDELTSSTNETNNQAASLEEASLVGTLPLYSVFISIPFVIFSTNYFGRKWTIICGTCIGITSWTILSITENIVEIYVSSFLRGLAGFILYTSIPIYIAEIANTNIRGILGSFVAIHMNFGILLSYILIICIQLKHLSMVGVIIHAISLLGMCFAPETPYFLIMNQNPIEAEKSLRKLRNSKDVSHELKDIQSVVEENEQQNENKWANFFTKQNLKISFIVLSQHVFQEFCGIDAILLFLQVILKSSDNHFFSNQTSSIIFGIGKMVSCTTALLLIDYAGRRPLQIISCLTTSVSLGMLGTFFYLKDVQNIDLSSMSWLPLVGLLIYIFSYNIGLGSVTFILASEMFPTKYKALGAGSTAVVFAISMLIVMEIVAGLKDSYGFHMAFWWLSFNTFIAFVFNVYFLPETKGKTFKEILDNI